MNRMNLGFDSTLEIGMRVCRTTMTLGFLVFPICVGPLGGCNRDDTIQRYEVAKTSDVPASTDVPAPATAANDAAAIHWTIPNGWKQLPGNEMRYCSFAVSADHPDLQLTVVPLAGNGGSLLSNINRWEGQIGLAPSSEADLKGLLSMITVAGAPVVIFDRTGPQPTDHTQPKRILAAIFSTTDRTWFFKLAGANDLIEGQKSAFDGFIRSVHFDSATDPMAGAAQGPANVPSVATPTTPADSALPITFVLPQGWTAESSAQSSPFRVAAFNVVLGADTAEAVVTHVAKDSGTMLENINRWRGQVDLDPLDDAAKMPSAKMTVHGSDAIIWDFNNTAAGHRMLVGMITHGGEWWFFKLTGSTALVAGEQSNFNSFVSSIAFRGDKGE